MITINRFLAVIFQLFGIKRLRDWFIVKATEAVRKYVQREFRNDRLGDKLMMHTALVFNRILLKMRDGKITDKEAEEIMAYLRRFYQVWSLYKSRRNKDSAKTVIDLFTNLKNKLE